MQRIVEKLNRYFHGKWRFAVLDMQRGRWIVMPRLSNIAYLKAENANGRHILIQPDPAIMPYYLMVDDVSWPLIQHQHQYKDLSWKPGRMVIETSTRNYQVWIHSSRPLSLDEKRFWLKRLNSDPGADPNNRWGRCPGFRNRKKKYQNNSGHYPLSKLIWIDWQRQAEIPASKFNCYPNISQRDFLQRRSKKLYHCNPITRSKYTRNDESATDFAYAMALFRRGFDEQFVRECILKERTDWQHHIGEKRMHTYLNRTIKRAKMFVERSLV